MKFHGKTKKNKNKNNSKGRHFASKVLDRCFDFYLVGYFDIVLTLPAVKDFSFHLVKPVLSNGFLQGS